MSSFVAELDDRRRRVLEILDPLGTDALLICGNEYSGFEGAIEYVTGFRIVHRHGYVLMSPGSEPVAVFPAEARWVGDHAGCPVEQVFAPDPGRWIADRAVSHGWGSLAVYGLSHIMPVCDYVTISASVAVVEADDAFDIARAVKSDAELESVRNSMTILRHAFDAVLGEFGPGRTEAEVLAAAEAVLVEGGSRRKTMNIVLAGHDGRAVPEFRLPDDARVISTDDLVIFSLEAAGRGGHWVELSRPTGAGTPAAVTNRMMEAYRAYFELAHQELRAGVTAHEAHQRVCAPFKELGLRFGHVTGHSIGMTMIEHPRVGEGADVELQERMVLSMHPHVMTEDATASLYMQDTFIVGANGAESLGNLDIEMFGDPRCRGPAR